MSASDLVDEGDAIWLVWREGRQAPQLYSCKVDKISRSSPDNAFVRLWFYQDNGVYVEPSEIELRREAMFGEDAMKSSSRAHLDWGYVELGSLVFGDHHPPLRRAKQHEVVGLVLALRLRGLGYEDFDGSEVRSLWWHAAGIGHEN